MNFKIIETGSDYPDVLLHRDRDENGKEYVNLLAIGTVNGQKDMFACESVVFESKESAVNFIYDFSKESAEKWCKAQKVVYS